MAKKKETSEKNITEVNVAESATAAKTKKAAEGATVNPEAETDREKFQERSYQIAKKFLTKEVEKKWKKLL